MKQVIIKFAFTLSFFTIMGCSSAKPTQPTQNDALKNVSPAHSTKESGIMQNGLDNFLHNDWIPSLEKNSEIKEKYMDKKERSFTLQEYVDKAAAYGEEHPQDYNKSNIKKLDNMPVIGK